VTDPPPTSAAGYRLVLSPREALVAGGPAEELEHRIQDLFRLGYQHVVVDLRAVSNADSAGLRAIVRGHTTAQRLGRRFTLVGPNAPVRALLGVANLDRVLDVTESLIETRSPRISWDRLLTVVAVIAVGMALVGVGMLWPTASSADSSGGVEQLFSSGPFVLGHPFVELAKLIAAAIIGMLVTVVYRQYRHDRTHAPTMDQAQVLLCVAGALMMIIIGNSLARAFGIAGAASIVRFRTPIEDPRDITTLFILMGLGMAAGLGAFAVAGLGTVFLCALLPVLSIFSQDRPRSMMVEIVASGRELPLAHVHQVFAVNDIVFEPREVSQGEQATIRYLTTLKPSDSLEDLSGQLMGDGQIGIKHVAWSAPKRT
jgi:anti-anti-sigma factor